MNQKKANKSVSDIVYYVIRIAILISVIFLFIPKFKSGADQRIDQQEYVVVYIWTFLFFLNRWIWKGNQERMGLPVHASDPVCICLGNLPRTDCNSGKRLHVSRQCEIQKTWQPDRSDRKRSRDRRHGWNLHSIQSDFTDDKGK